MKNLCAFGAALAAVLSSLCSCQEKISVDQTAVTGAVIHATIGDDLTKTSLSYNEGTELYDVLWSEGDKIIVILSSGMSESRREFTLSEGAGTTNGTFTSPDPIDWTKFSSVKAYYAYDGVDWPLTQKPSESAPCSHLPMFAMASGLSGSEAPELSFKNAGGILRINLTGRSIVKKIRVESDNMDAVTLTLPKGVLLGKTNAIPFDIALPERLSGYQGMKVTVIDDIGNEFTRAFKGKDGVVIERSMITSATLPTITINAGCKNGTFGLYDGCDAVLFNTTVDGYGLPLNCFVETENYNHADTFEGYYFRYDHSTYYYLDFTKYYFTIFNHRTGADGFPMDKWGLPTPAEMEKLMTYLSENGQWSAERPGLSIVFGEHEFYLPADGRADAQYEMVYDFGTKGCYWTNECVFPSQYERYYYEMGKNAETGKIEINELSAKNPDRNNAFSIRRFCSFPEK